MQVIYYYSKAVFLRKDKASGNAFFMKKIWPNGICR